MRLSERGGSRRWTTAAMLLAASSQEGTDAASSAMMGSSGTQVALNRQMKGEYDFLSYYSIKYAGCHRVSELSTVSTSTYDNSTNTTDTSTVTKVVKKSLARFRLCPKCSDDKTMGCTSTYGDYVVDMGTSADIFLSNSDYQTVDGMDLSNYTQCSEYKDDYGYTWYIGPYCSEQGGSVYLGMFSDSSCTVEAQSGKWTQHFDIPYTSEPMIPTKCLSCASGKDENSGYDAYSICQNIYKSAGKCESKNDFEYPNDSACNFISGVDLIKDNGMLSSPQWKKSMVAMIASYVLLATAVALAIYSSCLYSRLQLTRKHVLGST